MSDFIEFKNVSYSYYYNNEELATSEENISESELFAVQNVNMSIKKGEFVAIVGRNGSGKSTLARTMNAILTPNEGKIIIDGIEADTDENVWKIRCRVGMVFQNPDNQIVGISVEEDVAFGMENTGVPREEMSKRIEWALKTVKLEKERNTEPHLLSGGQKQRCAIAGIIAMKPECIVLDEATAMLDPIGRKEVLSLIKVLNKEQNITIVHITHHMDEVSEADRVVLIDKGRIIADTTPKLFFSDVLKVKEAGLEVPQITELLYILRSKGIDVPGDIISKEDGIKVLTDLIKTGGAGKCL